MLTRKHLIIGLCVATALAAQGASTPGDDGLEAVSDDQLGEMRGGTDLGNGLVGYFAIDRVVEALTNSGAVGAIGNRRAFRVAEEPLDMFRRYCAVYAREQAQCHFSPALIANLERYWDAQNRRG